MKTSQPGNSCILVSYKQDSHRDRSEWATSRKPPASGWDGPPLISPGDAARTLSNMPARMRMTRDYVRAFRGRLCGGGKYRVRLYESEASEGSSASKVPVVVCSELAEEDQAPTDETPLTDAVEYLAAEVIEDHRLAANPPRWIEHSPAYVREGGSEQWSYVIFAHYVPEQVLAPGGVWRRRIGRPERAPLDREAVEALIGQPV